ncbi:MAG: hypothetical protein L6R40_005818 [Gallowayella cf. fulva]|nr:MAG: hypothetical protein L6R40_005818 [Xanthomendoza cf. fulva]
MPPNESDPGYNQQQQEPPDLSGRSSHYLPPFLIMEQTLVIMAQTLVFMEQTLSVMEQTRISMDQTLFNMKQALFIMEQALFIMKQVFSSMEQDLFSMTRALSSMEQAFFSMKQTLFSMEQPLPSMEQARFSMTRILFSPLHHGINPSQYRAGPPQHEINPSQHGADLYGGSLGVMETMFEGLFGNMNDPAMENVNDPVMDPTNQPAMETMNHSVIRPGFDFPANDPASDLCHSQFHAPFDNINPQALSYGPRSSEDLTYEPNQPTSFSNDVDHIDNAFMVDCLDTNGTCRCKDNCRCVGCACHFGHYKPGQSENLPSPGHL